MLLQVMSNLGTFLILHIKVKRIDLVLHLQNLDLATFPYLEYYHSGKLDTHSRHKKDYISLPSTHC